MSWLAVDPAHLFWGGVSVVGAVLFFVVARRGPPGDTGPPPPGPTPSSLALLGLATYLLGHPGWVIQGVDSPAMKYAGAAAVKLVAAVLAVFVGTSILTGDDPLRLRSRIVPRHLAWGLIAYALTVPGLMLITGLLNDDVRQSAARELIDNRDPVFRAVLFFYVVVATPLLEEIVFRGAFQGAARRAMPPAAAIALSALVFTLVHERAVWLPVFLLGLLLAFVFERTRSLWSALAVHAVHNAIAFAYFTGGT